VKYGPEADGIPHVGKNGMELASGRLVISVHLLLYHHYLHFFSDDTPPAAAIGHLSNGSYSVTFSEVNYTSKTKKLKISTRRIGIKVVIIKNTV